MATREDAVIGLLDKLSPEMLEALAPGVGGFLEATFDPSVQLATLLKEQRRFNHEGKFALARALQPEIDLLSKQVSAPTSNKEWYGLIALLFLILLVAVWLAFRGV